MEGFVNAEIPSKSMKFWKVVEQLHNWRPIKKITAP
jgi:hypothetical protein